MKQNLAGMFFYLFSNLMFSTFPKDNLCSILECKIIHFPTSFSVFDIYELFKYMIPYYIPVQTSQLYSVVAVAPWLLNILFMPSEKRIVLSGITQTASIPSRFSTKVSPSSYDSRNNAVDK